MRDIPRTQVVQRLSAENPWWLPPHQLPAPERDLGPRAYLEAFHSLATLTSLRRAVVLMGPRRVGKTVLLRHFIGRLLRSGVPPQHICYISVDHPLYNGLGLEELFGLFLAAAGDREPGLRYVLFDEIQHLRQWEVHLKTLVDSRSDVRFVASGSAAAALKLKSRESGAGRFTEFLLPPLTFQEYVSLRGRRDALFEDGRPDTLKLTSIEQANAEFIGYLNFGGYPELALTPDARQNPGRFVKEDVIDKVLLRDLPSLYGIQDVQELNSLFTMLAFNTGMEVSLEALSKRSHVAKNTLKRYIEYLEAAFLIKIVHRVDQSARRFQRASAFKVYLTNPSMFAALLSPVDEDDEATPRLVETAVFAQWLHWTQPVYYSRWDGGEVDLVWLSALQRPSAAIEVKWSDRAVDSPQELKGLLAFCRKHGLSSAIVTTRTASRTVMLSEVRIIFIPASAYSLIAGQVLGDIRGEEAVEAARRLAEARATESQAVLPL